MGVNTFKRGSGAYFCAACKRLTRETGEGESGVGLCVHCYEVAGIENEIEDGYYNDPGDLAKAMAKIERLTDECRALGGKV